jgi:hypothetical protein
VYAGEKVNLEFASEGVVVRKAARMLDERGDLVAMVPLKGTTAGGTAYTLREGAVVTVKMNGVVIGSATMGAATAGGHGH